MGWFVDVQSRMHLESRCASLRVSIGPFMYPTVPKRRQPADDGGWPPNNLYEKMPLSLEVVTQILISQAKCIASARSRPVVFPPMTSQQGNHLTAQHPKTPLDHPVVQVRVRGSGFVSIARLLQEGLEGPVELPTKIGVNDVDL